MHQAALLRNELRHMRDGLDQRVDALQTLRDDAVALHARAAATAAQDETRRLPSRHSSRSSRRPSSAPTARTPATTEAARACVAATVSATSQRRADAARAAAEERMRRRGVLQDTADGLGSMFARILELRGSNEYGEMRRQRALPPPINKKAVPALLESARTLQRSLPDCCSICLEEMRRGQSAIALQCKHVFHRHCLVRWLERSQCCPMCKQRAVPDPSAMPMKGAEPYTTAKPRTHAAASAGVAQHARFVRPAATRSAPARAAASAVEYPPELRRWVSSALANGAHAGATRRIQRAVAARNLWATDWDSEPLPPPDVLR